MYFISVMPTYNIPVMKMKLAYCFGLSKLPLKEYCLKNAVSNLGKAVLYRRAHQILQSFPSRYGKTGGVIRGMGSPVLFLSHYL